MVQVWTVQTTKAIFKMSTTAKEEPGAPGEELSINSCTNCNRSHRKCDRKLPHCTECVKKKKQNCVYEPPKRPKKITEPKTDRYEPYPTTDASSPRTNFKFHQVEPLHKRQKKSKTLPTIQPPITLPSIHELPTYAPELERYFEQAYINTP